MKPQDLKIPFTWKKRKPFLLDGLLYLPKYYDKHHLFKNNPFEKDSKIFLDKKPFYIEYCSGNGQWITEKAMQNPEINWIAIEMRFDRARKIYAKKVNLNISNLFIVLGEGLTFTRYYVPDNMILKAYVNFPDPWPKKRHAKHRLVCDTFVSEMKRIVQRDGKVTLATDDKETSYRIISEFNKDKIWHSVFEKPFFINSWPGYGNSFFENLFIKKGKKIFYMQFENKKIGAEGFEPPTYWSQTSRASQAALCPETCL